MVWETPPTTNTAHTPLNSPGSRLFRFPLTIKQGAATAAIVSCRWKDEETPTAIGDSGFAEKTQLGQRERRVLFSLTRLLRGDDCNVFLCEGTLPAVHLFCTASAVFGLSVLSGNPLLQLNGKDNHNADGWGMEGVDNFSNRCTHET